MNNNTIILSVSIILAGILISLAIFFSDWGSDVDKNLTADLSININEETLKNITGRFSGEGSTIGDPNAPIKMVEYSDYTCPFCGLYWREILPVIKEKYIDEGLIYYEFKDFPVVGGMKASLAANCALEQGHFWEYHNLLFFRFSEDRRYWSENEIYQKYAEILNLDTDSFFSCLSEEKYREEVNKSTREAELSGARGTPFFLINKRPISGAVPIENFEEVINEELEFLDL